MKKNIINNLIILVLIAFGTTTFVSCSDDDAKEPTRIQLSTNTLEFSRLGLTSKGQTPSVFVYSNKYWTMRFAAEVDWLTVSPIAGATETEVTFHATENTSNAARTATLIFESLDGAVAELTVKQHDSSESIYYLQENMGVDDVSELNILGYDKWQKEGIGAIVTRYVGNGTKVDSSSPSSGYEGASGGNNILFPTAQSEFSWGEVATKDSSYFQLNFGLMSATAFSASNFKLYISNDNSTWFNLPYTRSADTGWAMGESKFSVSGISKLYFKMVAATGDVYRMDDIALTDDETRSGAEIEFEEPDPYPMAKFIYDEENWVYSQDFNSLVWQTESDAYKEKSYAEGAYWIKGETLPGWYLSRTGKANAGTFRIDNGAVYTAASFLSFGYLTKASKPNTDKTDEECLNRCLGSITNTASGGVAMMGVVIKNNTSKTIRSLAISYSGHLWKGPNNNQARQEKLEFSYAVNPTIILADQNLNNTDIMDNIVLGTAYPALDFNCPYPNETGGAILFGKMDGYAAQNMKEISGTLTVVIPPKGRILIRWKDEALDGESHNYGKAIDNLKVVAKF